MVPTGISVWTSLSYSTTALPDDITAAGGRVGAKRQSDISISWYIASCINVMNERHRSNEIRYDPCLGHVTVIFLDSCASIAS